MENLPQELLSSIIEHVGSYPAARLPYVTVSRRWQRTIELGIFESIRLIRHDDLPTFATLFRPAESHRKALIRSILFGFTNPPYDGEDWVKNHEIGCQVFSDSVHKLFRVLETFNEDEGVKRGGGISLSLNTMWMQENQSRPFINYIQLLGVEKLPILSCVSHFQVRSSGYSLFLDPVSTTFALNKLRRLKRFWLNYDGDNNLIDADTRKTVYSAFANALSAYTGSIEQFHIGFYRSRPYDDTIDPPEIIPATSQVDPVNLELHKLIQRAGISHVKLLYDCIISPEFFWPYDGVNLVPPKTPLWPNLRELGLEISQVTSGGDWYFLPDERIASYAEFTGEKDSVESSNKPREWYFNEFRSLPNPKTMNPLLIALSKVIRHASSLQTIQLKSSMNLRSRYVKKLKIRAFDLCYKAAGVRGRFSDTTPLDKRRMIWEVNDWRPDEDVVKSFEDALGRDGVMIYRDIELPLTRAILF